MLTTNQRGYDWEGYGISYSSTISSCSLVLAFALTLALPVSPLAPFLELDLSRHHMYGTSPACMELLKTDSTH